MTEQGELWVAYRGETKQDPSGLRKVGDNVWAADGGGAEIPAGGLLRQGFQEGSTVEPTREITELIEAQRVYDLNLKALRMQDEILGRAVNDVGRPTA